MSAAKWVMAAALVATTLVYWPGLGGPFVLDDAKNLNPILDWLQGDNTWRHALLHNGAGLLGRSLSMASLMLNAWIGGYDPWTFKFGNLIVHLLCGLVGWQVLRSALQRDQNMATHADVVAALLTAVWLLHPLNVSTVLYAVQRMAQASTLFTLAALWTYLSARTELQSGQLRTAICGLFAVFPILLFAGLISKENAAVAPALCLVLELAYFGHTRAHHENVAERYSLRAFYGVFLIVPASLVAVLFALRPGLLLGGYSGRDFTVMQRLLSESRALIDYIGALLLPRAPSMGVFTDDFATSTGLLSPPTTLYALIALAMITGFALAVRKRAPAVFAGWLFFLVAHAIESSFLPLELYFEHRNYLPAFGLFLACAGLLELLTRNVRRRDRSRRRLGAALIGAYLLALSFATLGRSLVWANEASFLSQEAKHHPDSVRANVSLAFYALHYNQPAIARGAMENLIHSPDTRTRELGYLNRVLVDCVSRGSTDPADLKMGVSLALPRVTLNEMYVFEDLASLDAERPCAHAGPAVLAQAIEALLDVAHAQPDGQRPKWRLRLAAADLYGRAGEWRRSLTQAKLAWQPQADPAVGAFLVRTYVHNGMLSKARETLEDVSRRTNRDNAEDERGLQELETFLDGAETAGDHARND